MRSRTLGVVITATLLVVASSALAAQPAERPSKPDILNVTPEELSGAQADALQKQAEEAYGQRRFQDAARAYVELLRMRRGDAMALYNLACCYGLLGNEAQAIRFLQAAWDAGFRDLEHIRSDPDFEKVRGKEYFKQLIDHLAAVAADRATPMGRQLEVTASVLATVRVIDPDDVRPGQRYPVLIALHGAGGSIETFARLFKGNAVAQPFFFCTPEALYGAAGGREANFVWFKPGTGERRRPPALQRKLANEYVLAVLEALLKAYQADPRRVFLMGFSQGGFLAYTVGLKNPELFAGVIPIGTWLDPTDFTPEEMTRAAAHTRVLLCHSPDDLSVAPSEARAASSFLEKYGVPHELVRYSGGHALTAEVARKVADWVAALPPPPREQ